MGVSWSMMCHWTLGVPFDGLIDAQRKGGEHATTVDELAAISARRTTYFVEKSGVIVLACVGFFLAMLGMFAFAYGYELAQAFFVMLVPLMFVQSLNMRLAFKIRALSLRGEDLQRALLRRRFWNQVIGLSAIVFAAGAALFNFAKQVVWY